MRNGRTRRGHSLFYTRYLIVKCKYAIFAVFFCAAACVICAQDGAAKSEGEKLFRLNKPEAAILVLEKEIEKPGSDPVLYNYLGICYYQTEKYSQALAVFQRALLLPGSDQYTLNLNAGNASFALKDYEGALQYFNAACTLQPESAAPVLNRANTLLKLKRWGDAKASYENFIKLESGNEQTPKIKELIELLEQQIEKDRLAQEALAAQTEMLPGELAILLADSGQNVEFEPVHEGLNAEPSTPRLYEPVAPEVNDASGLSKDTSSSVISEPVETEQLASDMEKILLGLAKADAAETAGDHSRPEEEKNSANTEIIGDQDGILLPELLSGGSDQKNADGSSFPENSVPPDGAAEEGPLEDEDILLPGYPQKPKGDVSEQQDPLQRQGRASAEKSGMISSSEPNAAPQAINCSVEVLTKKFTPDGDGVDDIAEFALFYSGASEKADKWELTIKDKDGKTLKTFGSGGAVPEKILWDGSGDGGERVIKSSEKYGVFLNIIPDPEDAQRFGVKAVSDSSELYTGVMNR